MPFRWPDNRLIDLFEIEHPIILAPMAGAIGCRIGGGGVGGPAGSVRCRAMLTPAQMRDQFAQIRASTGKPVNVNFFCHAAVRWGPQN